MLPTRSSHSAAIGPGVTGGPLEHPIPVSAEQQHKHFGPQVPSAGSDPFVVDPTALSAGNHKQHTQYPYVTGTSILAFTYQDGVIIACDTLGSYGATKRYKSFGRMHKVNDSCVLAAGGELSDYQYITHLLEELADDDFCMDDGHKLKPAEIFSYLSRVLYNRRNKFDPLWNSLVVGGFYDGKPFLGTVGMIGTCYKDETVATGFGNQLARPLMREHHRPDMDEAAAVALMHECLKVCYYRDKNSINKFQIAKVTKEGVTISEPFALETNWKYRSFIDPSANAPGTW